MVGIDVIDNNDFTIIDEVETLKNNFKINKVNYTFNDITFELYNHNGKYYFFHYTVYDTIIQTRKNPYNNQPLSSHFVNRIYLKKKINDIVIYLKSKNKEYDINHIYQYLLNSSSFFRNKYVFTYYNFLSGIHINYRYINDNLILQIFTNLGFDLKKNGFDKEIAYSTLGYLFSVFC